MDWSGLLNVAVIVILFLVMMRCCAGGMRGGCGGRRGRTGDAEGCGHTPAPPDPNTGARKDADSRRRQT